MLCVWTSTPGALDQQVLVEGAWRSKVNRLCSPRVLVAIKRKRVCEFVLTTPAPYRQEPTDGRRARDEEEGGGCLLSVDLPLGLQLSRRHRRLAVSQTRRHQLCLPLTSLVPSALFTSRSHHLTSPHLTSHVSQLSSRSSPRRPRLSSTSHGPRPSPRIHRSSSQLTSHLTHHLAAHLTRSPHALSSSPSQHVTTSTSLISQRARSQPGRRTRANSPHSAWRWRAPRSG